MTVHEPHAQGLIDQEQPVRGILGDGAQHRFGFQQGLLGEFPCRDVVSGAQHTRDAPAHRVAHRQHADIQPFAAAVDRAHASLTALRLSHRQARLPRGRDGPLLLVEKGEPTTVTVDLVVLATEHRLDALARPIRLRRAVRIQSMLEYESRRQGCHCAIAELALTERLLCRHPVRDVDHESDHAGRLPGRVAIGDASSVEQPAPRTVRMQIAILRLVNRFTAGNDRLGPGLHAIEVVRVHACFPRIQTNRIRLRRIAEHAKIELRAPRGTLSEIEVPHAPLCTLQCGLEATLTPSVLKTGGRGLGGLGHLFDEAGHGHHGVAWLLERDQSSGQQAIAAAG